MAEPAPLGREERESIVRRLRRAAWRLIVLVVGGTVVVVGLAMIVLPGPAFVVIPAGLAILATEFLWARRLLLRVRDLARSALANAQNGR